MKFDPHKAAATRKWKSKHRSAIATSTASSVIHTTDTDGDSGKEGIQCVQSNCA
jgi:hypothetical protein